MAVQNFDSFQPHASFHELNIAKVHVVNRQCISNKYEKHFPKMYRDVGMAVPKTTQTRYMDGSVQAT